MSNRSSMPLRSISNQNNTPPHLPLQKKPYKNKPITRITIINHNQIIKQNEILNIDPDDLSSVDWTLVVSPHSKLQCTLLPITSPKAKKSNSINKFTKKNHYSKT